MVGRQDEEAAPAVRGLDEPEGKYVTWASTTGRHVTEFSRQMEGCAEVTKKEWDRMPVEEPPYPLG